MTPEEVREATRKAQAKASEDFADKEVFEKLIEYETHKISLEGLVAESNAALKDCRQALSASNAARDHWLGMYSRIVAAEGARLSLEIAACKSALSKVAAVCERDDDLSKAEVLGEIAEICERALKGKL